LPYPYVIILFRGGGSEPSWPRYFARWFTMSIAGLDTLWGQRVIWSSLASSVYNRSFTSSTETMHVIMLFHFACTLWSTGFKSGEFGGHSCAVPVKKLAKTG